MKIIPAVDIMNGKVVRLLRGNYREVTVYSEDPAARALEWENEGAELLHVVDLDGARDGVLLNLDSIAAIAKKIEIPVEVGGGVRGREDVARLFDVGVARVILGTVAIENKNMLEEIVREFKEEIYVSLDIHKIIDRADGVYLETGTSGWIKPVAVSKTEFLKNLQNIGVTGIVCTDISKDGMLQGPNINLLRDVLESTSLSVIASGGISNIADIEKLAELKKENLEGAIVGKALYEGRFHLSEAISMLAQRGNEC
ncbi:MAG: 1-(5-phosphoribosyl)-5-[(5-phosphoribosylamino)methylideneamino]imidazole-4-carboxamide isomerase [Candidatus Omnitrophica bacterium]|nr:1-(5-phosphoribosyl)-5-[(5-phosphoribosylamino)methylideneamino]imidazole-4-carboxamide isomerase [Candidatus Omnitrophota bacterium]